MYDYSLKGSYSDETKNETSASSTYVKREKNVIIISGRVCDKMADQLILELSRAENDYKKEMNKIKKELKPISFTTELNASSCDEEKLKDFLMCEIQQNLKKENGLKLYMTSYGGDLLSGFRMADAIRLCELPIDTYVKGYVASAMTLPFMYGRKKYMDRHSFMLVHQLRGMFWGKYEDTKIEQGNLDRFMETIIKIYEEKTNSEFKDKINGFLKDDDWWDPNTCLRYGLIDEII